MMSRLLSHPVVSTVLTMALSVWPMCRAAADQAAGANPQGDLTASEAVPANAIAPEAVVASGVAAPQEALAAVEGAPAKLRSGWVARLFWSPEYCNKHRGSREGQCGLPLQGFVCGI